MKLKISLKIKCMLYTIFVIYKDIKFNIELNSKKVYFPLFVGLLIFNSMNIRFLSLAFCFKAQ